MKPESELERLLREDSERMPGDLVGMLFVFLGVLGGIEMALKWLPL